MSSAMGSTALALCLAALRASEAEARRTRLRGQEPSARSAYEKLVGRAYGEIDPKDPKTERRRLQRAHAHAERPSLLLDEDFQAYLQRPEAGR